MASTNGKNTTNVTVLYKPYPKQASIHKSKSKRRMVAVGRQAGKTHCAAAEVILQIQRHMKRFPNIAQQKKLVMGWIAPTYAQAMRGEDALKEIGVNLMDRKIMKIGGSGPRYMEMFGHKLYFLSSDNPDSLRGYHFDFLIIDEAAYVSDDVWRLVLAPTLFASDGDLLAISTPAGKRGWFYEEYQKGLDPESENVSFNWASWENIYLGIPKEGETDEQRRDRIKNQIEKEYIGMPNLFIEQEVMAVFTDRESDLFENIDGCNSIEPCKCKGIQPIMAVDLAKHYDFTIGLIICPNCMHVVDLERFNKLSWTIQWDKLERLYRRYDCQKMIIDANSIGDTTLDVLKEKGLNVDGFKITAQSKKQLVLSLIDAIERNTIKWDFKEYPLIKQEFQTFRPSYNIKTGNTTYNAVGACHDDIVIAMGLAVQLLISFTPPEIFVGEETGIPDDDEWKWNEVRFDGEFEDMDDGVM